MIKPHLIIHIRFFVFCNIVAYKNTKNKSYMQHSDFAVGLPTVNYQLFCDVSYTSYYISLVLPKNVVATLITTVHSLLFNSLFQFCVLRKLDGTKTV